MSHSLLTFREKLPTMSNFMKLCKKQKYPSTEVDTYFSYFSIILFCSIQDRFYSPGHVELHCLGAFLVVTTIDSGFQEFQWFGNSVVGLSQYTRLLTQAIVVTNTPNGFG